MSKRSSRDSTKHGPRLDEALEKETESITRGAPIESRVEEGREHEGPGDEDRDVGSRTGAPGSLGSDPVEARRELSRHLRPSVFPATRDELIAEARSQTAPQPVADALQRLPDGVAFATVHEVWAALERHPDFRGAARTDPLSGATG